MTAVIEIDLNVRLGGPATYAGLEDVHDGTLLVVGDPVVVQGIETDLCGRGVVTRIDDVARLVYIDVDWSSIKPVESPRDSTWWTVQRFGAAARP